LGKDKEVFVLVRIIEQLEGHYEVQDVEFGKVYKWHPDSAIIECECGKRSTYSQSSLIGSVSTCECGEDHMEPIQEEELITPLPEEDEALHPWRYWKSSDDTGLPF
jgi:hypothetical protein